MSPPLFPSERCGYRIDVAVVNLLLYLLPRLQATYHTFRSLYYRSGGHTKKALAAEEKVGRILADSLLADMPLDSNRSDKDFVSSVATSLVAQTRAQGYSFRFHLVRAREANAFALPGGFVFVTKPLVELCQQNSDEMAFVLAHEVGHVVKSHVTNRMVDGLLLSMATSLVLVGGHLAVVLRRFVLKALVSAYSRDQEFEAD